MALGLQFVSAFWFYKIVKMVKYKLSKRRKKVISIRLHRKNWTEPVLLAKSYKDGLINDCVEYAA